MADKTDKKAQAGDKEPKKKMSGKLKLVILLVVALLVLGAGGFAAWKFLLHPAPAEESHGNATGSAAGENQTAPAASAAPSQLVTLEPFVVNLSDPMGRRYLKVTMDVEVTDSAAATELGAAMPKVKDTLLLLLSSKTFAEISSLDKKIELKNEIVDRLNLIIGKSKVRNVYFTEFVVQ
jgi:flagellar FliL protein